MSMNPFSTKPLEDARRGRDDREPEPFRLITVRGSGVRPGVDLDRPRALEVEEDEERFRRD